MSMPDARRLSTDIADLAAVFTHFAENRCGTYAPLYARLGAGIAGDRDLLAIAVNATPGQSPPDLMLAAVHYLLARDSGDPLASYYPSMVFTPAVGDPVPDFRRFCLQHRDELLRLVSSWRVQTNEARRCCYLLPAVMLVGRLAGRPLALIEPGASAGLNLAMDAYAYAYGTWVKVGDASSQLLLRCGLHGPPQAPLHLPVPQVVWRAGIDINPLDPTDPQDAAWLRALVWPDHRDRVPRLTAALRIASCRPAVQMFAGDALSHLPTAVDVAPAEAAVCIFHTAFLAHFSQADRDRFNHQVLALSRCRTIYWIQAEPRRDPAEPRLRLTVCDAGRVSREWPLGHYQPHGAWLKWVAADIPAGT
jgi:hypothetical protein